MATVIGDFPSAHSGNVHKPVAGQQSPVAESSMGSAVFLVCPPKVSRNCDFTQNCPPTLGPGLDEEDDADDDDDNDDAADDDDNDFLNVYRCLLC